MKLVYPEWNEQLIIREGEVTSLFVENPDIYKKIIIELYGQYRSGNGKFVLSNDNIEMQIKKDTVMILHPLIMDFDSRQMIGKLHSILMDKAYSEDMQFQTHELQTAILRYCVELEAGLDYELVSNDEVDLPSVFKSVSLRPCESYENLLDQILAFMKINTELFCTRLFIFCHLVEFLTHEELVAFKKEVKIKQYNVLMMECRPEFVEKDEKCYIIDKDYCFI